MTLRRLIVYPLVFVAVTVGAVVVWYLLTLYRPGAPHRGWLALTGGTVLVGPDLQPRPRTTVLVRDGTIVAVGDDGTVEVPDDATVVDASGATVLPGLIDLHVHLGSPERARDDRPGPFDIVGVIADAARYAPSSRRSLLGHGVTTVRSLGDDHAWIVELRRMLRDGELEGPRVYAAGPLFTTAQGHPVVTIGVDPGSDGVRIPESPAEARRAVRALTGGDDPVDLIKVVQERGGRRRSLQPLPPEILYAIVAEAHANGVPVAAHWGTADDLREVLDAGVDDLQHLEARGQLGGWPEDLLAALVQDDIPLSPTLAVSEVSLPPDVHRRLRTALKQFHAAGGRVAAGSDAGMPGVGFGAGLHRELELLVDSGLSAREAVQAATSVAADVLGADDIGAIATGRAADLVVVDGDPTGDITALADVVLVFRDGRTVVDRR